MARPLSIRQILLRILLLLIGLLGGGALAATLLGGARLIDTLARVTMTKTIQATEARLDGFFGPVQATLEVVRDWGASGLLPLHDPERLTELMVPILRNHPQTTAFILADDGGREHLLQRAGTGWSERRVAAGEAVWREWSDGEAPGGSSREATPYDPRARPWFHEAAAAPGEARWTLPYAFYVSQAPGLTVATRFLDPQGTGHVVAFDVRLAEISAFTETLRPTRNGFAFVTTLEGRLVGLPASEEAVTAAVRRASLLQFPDDLGIPLLADVVGAWLDAGGPIGAPLQISSLGERFWGEARDYEVPGAAGFRVGVVVPESDLVGDVTVVQWAIAVLTVVFLGLASLRALAIARRVSEPIEDLVRRSDRIGHGDLEPEEPLQTRILEVQNLAEAQEQMRSALRSLMRVERDLALAREIQQRALPEALPRLPGYEIAAWSEPAQQTGGDSYDAIGCIRDARGEPTLVTRGDADVVFCMVADAAGHGVGPALSVTQVRSMFRMGLRSGAELSWMVRHLNEQLVDDLPPGRFITAWFGEVDATAHTLTGFSAGQAPLLLYRAADGEILSLPADSPPLGILDPDHLSIAPPLGLAPGDLFAVVSDGVFETTDPAGEAFGEERVFAILKAEAGGGAEAALAALRRALERFAKGVPAADDSTVLLIRRIP